MRPSAGALLLLSACATAGAAPPRSSLIEGQAALGRGETTHAYRLCRTAAAAESGDRRVQALICQGRAALGIRGQVLAAVEALGVEDPATLVQETRLSFCLVQAALTSLHLRGDLPLGARVERMRITALPAFFS